MTEGIRFQGWFDEHVAKETSKDKVRPSERFGQLAGVVIALIFAAYFTVLYTSSSGFFTSDFTTLEAVLFFGIAYFGIVPGLLKTIIGRKNSTRPLDIILSISLLVAGIWFLSTFPFDFSHLPDALPSSFQFLVSWVSDGLVKVLMVLAIVISIFVIPYTVLLYLGVRKKLSQSSRERGVD